MSNLPISVWNSRNDLWNEISILNVSGNIWVEMAFQQTIKSTVSH